ncbi:MAG TPA: peptide chain release factor N(5)-glutamine methyltransferase [Rhodanobacteraceae bacterium]|nr:peptide chain release factor N(5)-glutamine methyltransferase [Rhodanobacteraceae bacterium]
MNVRDLLASATARLGGPDARLDAELLLAHALGRPRAWLYAWPEHDVDAMRRDAFDRLVAARAGGEPIAYLTGRREFWSLELAVTRDVLIPRHETELLVELALARIPPERGVRVADLGTGSGAIALAIARERPHAHVLATDASDAALAIARGNAERLAIGNVTFAHGDWFGPLGAERFEVIVSNPPYIEAGDAHLAAGDVRFEPRAALVSGDDGLDAIRRIAAVAPSHLESDGWLLIEHGFDQGERVRGLFAASGFSDIESVRDAGGHARVTFGRRHG